MEYDSQLPSRPLSHRRALVGTPALWRLRHTEQQHDVAMVSGLPCIVILVLWLRPLIITGAENGRRSSAKWLCTFFVMLAAQLVRKSTNKLLWAELPVCSLIIQSPILRPACYPIMTGHFRIPFCYLLLCSMRFPMFAFRSFSTWKSAACSICESCNVAALPGRITTHVSRNSTAPQSLTTTTRTQPCQYPRG
jgi:hypothetical protein